jgi:chemotaxis signal transduction protein
MVCFRTKDGQFALPVEATIAVRRTDGLVPLPMPREGVVGMLAGDPPISVLSSLGIGGDHILVVTDGDVRYGLHVLEVMGVRRFDDDQFGPPPHGQRDQCIAATLSTDELVLVADAHALAARL